MFVKASVAPSHPWNCWICMGGGGTVETALSPPGLETVGPPHCIVSTLPIYGAFLISLHTRSFSLVASFTECSSAP